ncbi:MAG: acetoin utilization protein AcuC [Alphaproteobacteria bacterium]|nr:acetoin utilization protein AcuC [Alphaproteobacteria bacterium]
MSTVVDLCRALGWLEADQYVDSPQATPDQLRRFHDPAYIRALQETERTQRISTEARRRYHIGANGNPIFGQVFSRPATACGATLAAVTMLRAGGVVHSPAGGTHHGRPDRASGFCYFNEPVLGILALLDDGHGRVAYVDVDAHHCDGVEDALIDDPRVLTISIHEAGRWPHTGQVSRRMGDGGAINLPVPEGFHDDELALLRDEIVMPALAGFGPDAIILQAGADGLADDPLSRLALSNKALWDVVRAVQSLTSRLLVLGGGGYNPWSVGRCWSGIWGILNGREIPDRLPAAAESVLRELSWSRSAGRNPPQHWFTTLSDPPRVGPIRHEIRDLAEKSARNLDRSSASASSALQLS